MSGLGILSRMWVESVFPFFHQVCTIAPAVIIVLITVITIAVSIIISIGVVVIIFVVAVIIMPIISFCAITRRVAIIILNVYLIVMS